MPSDVVLQEDPPVWLTEAVRKHQPSLTMRMGGLICEWCTYMDPKRPDDRGIVVWTPEHMSREIHKTLGEHLIRLLNGT